MNNTIKLRNMTSIYIIHNDKILMLYRQGSKVANNMWIGAAGGHFEDYEINDPKACLLRELNEELSLTEDMLTNLKLRYITLRNSNGEIRQNYYYFANLTDMNQKISSNEGILQWIDLDKISALNMPFTAKFMLEHYLLIGKSDDKLYGGIANDKEVNFTELKPF